MEKVWSPGMGYSTEDAVGSSTTEVSTDESTGAAGDGASAGVSEAGAVSSVTAAEAEVLDTSDVVSSPQEHSSAASMVKANSMANNLFFIFVPPRIVFWQTGDLTSYVHNGGEYGEVVKSAGSVFILA